MTSRIAALVAALGAAHVLASLTPAQRTVLRYRWPVLARRCEERETPRWLKTRPGFGVWGGQQPPPGDWSTWLYLAGRGSGKSRTGAEQVRAWAEEYPGCHIALVGATGDDARRVMIRSKRSGLLRICPPWNRPHWNFGERTLTWPNDSVATLYTADEPKRLEGPEHDFAWADEIRNWTYPEALDALQLGLRCGAHPRLILTTTPPEATSVIVRLMGEPDTALTIGSTVENAANLPASTLAKFLRKYKGTTLGRRDLEGEVLMESDDALWTRALIAAAHEDAAVPKDGLERVVVAVDPSGLTRAFVRGRKVVVTTAGDDEQSGRHDLAGIVVAGIDGAGRCYVLADRSSPHSPHAWAREAVAVYHHFKADAIIYETAHGGKTAEDLLREADPNAAIRGVDAHRGKYARAEPVVSLYEQGRVKHAGEGLEVLEDQMCSWTQSDPKSPDRLDALVYALTELAIGPEGLEYAGTIG